MTKTNVEKIKTLKAKGGKKSKQLLAQEMYQYYLAGYKAGIIPAPIGSNTPLTENEYCKRWLYGIGGASKVVKGKKKVTLKKRGKK